MLRHPEWRLKVIKDLGGVDKLIRLWKRLSEPHESLLILIGQYTKIKTLQIELTETIYRKMCPMTQIWEIV
jgi:hypothetical protein